MTVGRRSDWRILGSNLSLISTVMHWNCASYFSALVFLVQVEDISYLNGFPSKIFREGELIGKLFFRYIDSRINILNQFTNYFFQLIYSKITRVWHCDKLRLRPRGHVEQTLTFLYAVHSTWEQTVSSLKCSTVHGLDEEIR